MKGKRQLFCQKTFGPPAALGLSWSGMPPRLRDPVLNAPLLTMPTMSRGTHRRAQRRWNEELNQRRRANQSISALKGLARGAFDDSFFADTFGEPRAWDIAGPNSQEVSSQALAAEVATGDYPGREEIDVAFGRLMERRGRKEAKASGNGAPRAQGDLRRKVVNQRDLPEAGSTPTMLDQVSKTAAQ